MGVSKYRGTAKWMVYNGKPYQNGMIWGYHYFWTHPFIYIYTDKLINFFCFASLEIPLELQICSQCSSQPQGRQLVSIEIMSAPCTGFATGSMETDKEGLGGWGGWGVFFFLIFGFGVDL